MKPFVTTPFTYNFLYFFSKFVFYSISSISKLQYTEDYISPDLASSFITIGSIILLILLFIWLLLI